jgi:hypothetical protein
VVGLWARALTEGEEGFKRRASTDVDQREKKGNEGDFPRPRSAGRSSSARHPTGNQMATKTTDMVDVRVGEDGAESERPRPLPMADKVALGLIGFFVVMAFTIELYFILHYRDIREQSHFFAKAYAIYGAGDQAYFGRGDIYVPLALETINVFFSQLLNLLTAWAIVKRRPWRHPLQLLVGSYLTYSVVFYFWVNHVSGYVNMPEKTPWAFFIFYAPNLPWLLGHGWMAWHSFVVMTKRLRGVNAARG